MTDPADTSLRLLLASPDPVIIVADRDDEPIVTANMAARGLFGRGEPELRGAKLRELLPNVVAGSIAVHLDRALSADRFVRAWARTREGLEPVTIGALFGSNEAEPCIAVFVRSDKLRLEKPFEAEISEARLQFALDSAGIGDWDLDLRTNTAFRSRLHDACFGYPVSREQWGYDTFLRHVHPDDRERVNRTFMSARDDGHDYDIEFRAVWPDGSVHWLWSKGRFYYDAAGTPIRVAGIQVDIDNRKRAEEGIRLSALAMASTADAIVIADVRAGDYPIVYANEAFERVTGYLSSELIGHNCRMLQGPETARAQIDEVRAALGAERECRVTLRNYRKDGSAFWNQLTLSPVRDEAGRLTHYVGVLSDVTRGKQFEDELLHRATHDPLTTLPNRGLLEERLAASLRNAERDGTCVAVAFVDIDRLKRVNDSLGHAGGDTLISAVASRLKSAVRANDTVGRYGGDEFVLVFSDLADAEAAEHLVSRLHGILDNKLLVKGIEIIPSASVGVALYPHHATSVVDLIRFADTALYAAKATDRGSYRFFDRSSMQPAADPLSTENALKRALVQGELSLDYQPIFNARTGHIAAVEALLRWRSAERGLVPPCDFIPLAEESGLIVPIGEWVLTEICRQHRRWQRDGVPLVPIAMNVSIAQFRRRDFCPVFRATVADAGVDPRWIVLEITESIVMDNAELFLEKLTELRAKGARVSIDDFGTGFSSLNYIKRLKLDTLKIDKSFVDDIATDTNAAAICRAIVTLSHSVGLTAVAEGVETPEQAAFLRSIDCDELQGFHFARPASAGVVEQLLRAEHARSV